GNLAQKQAFAEPLCRSAIGIQRSGHAAAAGASPRLCVSASTVDAGGLRAGSQSVGDVESKTSEGGLQAEVRLGFRELSKSEFQIFMGVRGRDLHANARFALRHYRIGKPD